MGFFKKFVGKSEGDKVQADKAKDNKQKPGAEETRTVLRQPDKPTPITKEKDRAERSALEIAEQQDWEVKTLPVWRSGDTILDTYEVEGVISGGMGHVYIANHKNWNVKLAIKSPNEMMLSDKSNFARILREANSWTELGLHPNIAYCYYVRNIEDVPHIFVEYVDGGNLRQWIEEGKCIDCRTSLDLAIQFCHGMEHAHAKGMIHRDIKPENILMTKDGILKITDFGLVRGDGTGPIQSSIEQSISNQQQEGHRLTTVGTFMGTEGYMAPEQAESAGDVNERADVFSFGVCLYEMFCGNKPYKITYGPKQEPPDPVKLSMDKNFPLDLCVVLKRCVNWSPSERYDSFDEIRKEIIRIYSKLFNDDSAFAALEHLNLEADGLNNKGVSLFELGNEQAALECWQQAIERNSTHLQATYNLSLVEWRSGRVADDEVVRRLELIKENHPPGEVEQLLARVHVESLQPSAAMQVLEEFPEKFEKLFGDKDLNEIRSLANFSLHGKRIKFVTFSLDGSRALSVCNDQKMYYWDLSKRKFLASIKGDGRSEFVNISPDGRYSLWRNNDKTLIYWDLEKHECLAVLEGHTEYVRSVSFSPDGRYALSGSNDHTLRYWDLDKRECLAVLEGHTESVSSVSISPDGRHALSGGFDTTVRFWDLEQGECLAVLESHNQWVNCVSISSDGGRALSAGGSVYGPSDYSLRYWDLKKCECLAVLEGHTDNVNSVTFSPDGRYALSGSNDRVIRFWDVEKSRCLATLAEHTHDVTSIRFSPDGCYALSGSADKTIRFWELKTNYNVYLSSMELCRPHGFVELREEEKQKQKLFEEVQRLIGSEKGEKAFKLLTNAWKAIDYRPEQVFESNYINLCRHGITRRLHANYDLIMSAPSVKSVGFSPDGCYALSGSYDRQLRYWDLKSIRCVAVLQGHNAPIYSICFSPDGRHVITSAVDTPTHIDHDLRYWDLEKGTCLTILKGHTGSVFSVSISPDGRRALSGSEDKTVRYWDLENGECLDVFREHIDFKVATTGAVTSVNISPDGCYALSGSVDKTMRYWSLEKRECLSVFKGHADTVYSAIFSPDGRHALSGSKDKTVRYWNLKKQKSLGVFEGHTGPVTSISFSPDGRYALSGSYDKTLRLWQIKKQECIAILEGHTDYINSVSFSPDGRHALSGSTDGTMRLWRFIWDLEFPDPVDWDEGARPYLEIFLTLTNGEWTEGDFQALITELAEKRGYGWVRPEGIRKELEKMTKNWKP